MEKRRRRSKAERDARNAEIDKTIRRLRELAEKGQAELDRKRAAEAAAE